MFFNGILLDVRYLMYDISILLLGMLIWVRANQDPGSVQMVSISGSYLAQVAGGGAIRLVRSVV